MRTWKLPAAIAIAAIAVGGCGSSSKSSSTTTPATTTSTTAVAGTTPPTTTGVTTTTKAAKTTGSTIPTSVANVLTKRKQVALTKCAVVPGGWAASGTANNPTKSAVSYKITVFFTTAKATVEGTGAATVTVAAGKRSDWKATGTFKATSTTLCVLRGVG